MISHSSTMVVFGLVLLQSAVARLSPSVVVAPSAGNSCPSGYVKLTTVLGCRAAMEEINLFNFQGTERESDWPGGCYLCDGVADCSDGVWFNENSVGSANGEATPICVVPGWEDAKLESVETLFVGDSDIDYWATNDEYPDSVNVGVAGYMCDDVNKILDARLRDCNPKRAVTVCWENDLWDQGGHDLRRL